MTALLQEVTLLFRELFNDDELTLHAGTRAADVQGWDSLMHLNLIVALEKRFAIKFTTSEISRLKEDDQNIGTLVALIAAKKGSTR